MQARTMHTCNNYYVSLTASGLNRNQLLVVQVLFFKSGCIQKKSKNENDGVAPYEKIRNFILTLLHLEQPKLYGVLAVLSATWLR